MSGITVGEIVNYTGHPRPTRRCDTYLSGSELHVGRSFGVDTLMAQNTSVTTGFRE